MKLLSLLSLLLPILATVRGQSSVSLGLSISTIPITRRVDNSADEGETFRVCLNTNNGAPSTTSTVRVESEDGTATAPDDYNSVSVTLTFNQGNIEECVSLMLVDDDLDEQDEWLLVRINGLTGNYSNFEAIVNITISGGSNGGVGISLEQDSYDVSESEGSVEVCAVQNGNVPNLAGDIVVILTTSSTSGSTAATVGGDYTQVSRELVFVPASAGTRNCVDIPITQDELAEGNEVFQVNLGTRNIFYQSFIGPIRTATITIADEPATEPTSDTEATEPTSDTDATEPTSNTDATEPTDDDTTTPTATPTATPTTDDGGASDDPTTGGDMNTDGTTSTPPGGDSNPNTPNTGSNPNDNGEGPDSNSNPTPDGNVSEDNDAPETVGVSDYGVIVRSFSPILLLLVSSLGLLL